MSYNAKLTISYGNLETSQTVALGAYAVAVMIRLPTAGATDGWIALDGAAPVTLTVGGASNTPQGALYVGAGLVDGVAQTEAGTAGITAVIAASGRTTATVANLWSLASRHLAPIIATVSATANTGGSRTLDFAPFISDPALAGYSCGFVASSGNPTGFTSSVLGTVLTYSATAGGTYTGTLTVTSLHPLAPVATATVSLRLTSAVGRWSNGYLYRFTIRRPAWPNGTLRTNYLLPFCEFGDDFKSVANGGLVESDSGFDIRFEETDGTQLAHRLIGYDPTVGRLPGLLNFESNLAAAETIYLYIGKPGLSVSEENITGTRAGGWVAFHQGGTTTDYSGNGRTLTTSGTVTASSIGPWPAGLYDGTASYRSRTSAELNASAGFFVAALVSSGEAIGRTQEFLNIAPDAAAQLAMRLQSTGAWASLQDVGGALQGVTSDTGFYRPGAAHCLAGSWASGERPQQTLDGRTIDPPAVPTVATGTTAMSETFEIGRGNRPSGTASYWNGQIGPVLMATSGLTRAERETITAALCEPRLVYGISDFSQVADTNQPFAALPMGGSGPSDSATSFDVVANAYNPGGLTLTVSLPTQPTGGSSSVSGDSVLVTPTAAGGSRVRVPYTLTNGALTSTGIIDVAVSTTAPVVGFNSALPLGGLGVGLPCLFGGPGNVRITSFGVILMQCEHTGSINRVSWQNRFDLSHGNTGYSTGEGGKIYWTLRRVTSAAGVRPLVMGSVLARTASINQPANIAPFQSAFAAAGGSGTVQEDFARMPTLVFQNNVSVTAGEWLAFTQIQEDSAGTVSTNNAYSTLRVQNDFSPYLYGEARHFANGSTSNQRPEHYPLLLYGYTDNFVCGNSHFFYANGVDADAILVPGRGVRVRQSIPMPNWANGRIVKSVHVMAVRMDSTTTADLVCRVRRADGTADGAILGTDQAAANTFTVKSNLKQTSQTADPTPFTRFDFPTTGTSQIAIQGGTTYYFEISTNQGGSSTTRYIMDRMDRFLDFAPVGLRHPTYVLSGMRGQRNTGSSWADLAGGGRTHDVPVYVEFA